ncbi:hypothetical protein HQ520_05740 [bacterium]|nr:hypothetical protein [bacterium]
MRIPNIFIGDWRILHMDKWDQDFVDLVVAGHITFRRDGTGSFEFGAVQGEMDSRVEQTATGDLRLAFSWAGSDECDSVSGRGWAKVGGKEMTGHIAFHLGDESGFRARKKE